jgi:ABC-type microcin C transport system permease subunit YejB
MVNYFIRRFLLIIPTFLGITFLCFTVMRFVPGGPVEQAILTYQQSMASGGEAGSSGQISEEMVQKLKEIYGFDKPFYQAYFIWLTKVCKLDLGTSDTFSRPVWDVIKERFPISITFGLIGFLLSYTICVPLGVFKAIKHGSNFDTLSSIIVFIGYSIPGWTAGVFLLLLFGGGSFVSLVPLGGIHSDSINSDMYLSKYLLKGGKASDLPADVLAAHQLGNHETIFSDHPAFVHFTPQNIVQPEKDKTEDKPFGYVRNLPPSIKKMYQLRAEQTINEKHPAFKNIPEDKKFQITSGTNNDLSTFGYVLDLVWHMILPIMCYMIGSFASLTVLMKNSLMENLGQDYVRTAFAKGLSEKTVIFKHALRNSLIPIATGLGHALSIVLAGSYLIEKVFNIQGFGLLGYTSLIARDYPVSLGILVIGASLRLLGNIISDFLYCVIDPRIRFS